MNDNLKDSSAGMPRSPGRLDVFGPEEPFARPADFPDIVARKTECARFLTYLAHHPASRVRRRLKQVLHGQTPQQWAEFSVSRMPLRTALFRRRLLRGEASLEDLSRCPNAWDCNTPLVYLIFTEPGTSGESHVGSNGRRVHSLSQSDDDDDWLTDASCYSDLSSDISSFSDADDLDGEYLDDNYLDDDLVGDDSGGDDSDSGDEDGEDGASDDAADDGASDVASDNAPDNAPDGAEDGDEDGEDGAEDDAADGASDGVLDGAAGDNNLCDRDSDRATTAPIIPFPSADGLHSSPAWSGYIGMTRASHNSQLDWLSWPKKLAGAIRIPQHRNVARRAPRPDDQYIYASDDGIRHKNWQAIVMFTCEHCFHPARACKIVIEIMMSLQCLPATSRMGISLRRWR
jgi:hypothetical protein